MIHSLLNPGAQLAWCLCSWEQIHMSLWWDKGRHRKKWNQKCAQYLTFFFSLKEKRLHWDSVFIRRSKTDWHEASKVRNKILSVPKLYFWIVNFGPVTYPSRFWSLSSGDCNLKNNSKADRSQKISSQGWWQWGRQVSGEGVREAQGLVFPCSISPCLISWLSFPSCCALIQGGCRGISASLFSALTLAVIVLMAREEGECYFRREDTAG